MAKRMTPVQVTHMSAERREEWNTFVAQQPSFAFMQSWEWGDFKEALGWKAFRIAALKQGRIVAGVQMLIRRVPPGLVSLAYAPRGPVGDWLDEEITPPLLCELHRVARHHRAIFLRIEPPLLNGSPGAQALARHHFRRSSYTNQPRATLIVDLAQGLDQVMARMHHKTRYNIRYAAKKGVTIRVGGLEDLATFCSLMHITGRRGGFSPRAPDYYRSEWETFAAGERIRLLIASYQGETLAVNMSAVFGEHAAYLHGASSGEHGNVQPNYLLMWEAIQWAKAQNCRTFDLWGIPDEVGLAVYAGDDLPVSSRTDGLWGVYRFKRGFSNNVVLYMSAHDYVYSPPLYALVTNKLFNTGLLDRIAVRIDALRRV
jgi:lipid II:glycine glycyltransferase (peptidoglycan interpeptide bridge formation enzyme)